VKYKFQLGPEFTWALLTAVSAYLLQVTASVDFAAVGEWRPVLISIGVGLLRAVLGAIISMMTTPKPGTVTVEPGTITVTPGATTEPAPPTVVVTTTPEAAVPPREFNRP
jgi:hypothetical protein